MYASPHSYNQTLEANKHKNKHTHQQSVCYKFFCFFSWSPFMVKEIETAQCYFQVLLSKKKAHICSNWGDRPHTIRILTRSSTHRELSSWNRKKKIKKKIEKEVLVQMKLNISCECIHLCALFTDIKKDWLAKYRKPWKRPQCYGDKKTSLSITTLGVGWGVGRDADYRANLLNRERKLYKQNELWQRSLRWTILQKAINIWRVIRPVWHSSNKTPKQMSSLLDYLRINNGEQHRRRHNTWTVGLLPLQN